MDIKYLGRHGELLKFKDEVFDVAYRFQTWNWIEAKGSRITFVICLLINVHFLHRLMLCLFFLSQSCLTFVNMVNLKLNFNWVCIRCPVNLNQIIGWFLINWDLDQGKMWSCENESIRGRLGFKLMCHASNLLNFFNVN